MVDFVKVGLVKHKASGPILNFEQYPYKFLSNFYAGEGSVITINHIRYPTSEHAFQAGKSVKRSIRRQVAKCATPGDSKRMGKRIERRSDWDIIRVYYMLFVVRLKFSHPLLAEWLLLTGDRLLVEGNTWNDNFWGATDFDVNGNIFVGENMLGRILMHVRKELRLNRQLVFKI